MSALQAITDQIDQLSPTEILLHNRMAHLPTPRFPMYDIVVPRPDYVVYRTLQMEDFCKPTVLTTMQKHLQATHQQSKVLFIYDGTCMLSPQHPDCETVQRSLKACATGSIGIVVQHDPKASVMTFLNTVMEVEGYEQLSVNSTKSTLVRIGDAVKVVVLITFS